MVRLMAKMMLGTLAIFVEISKYVYIYDQRYCFGNIPFDIVFLGRKVFSVQFDSPTFLFR